MAGTDTSHEDDVRPEGIIKVSSPVPAEALPRGTNAPTDSSTAQTEELPQLPADASGPKQPAARAGGDQVPNQSWRRRHPLLENLAPRNFLLLLLLLLASYLVFTFSLHPRLSVQDTCSCPIPDPPTLHKLPAETKSTPVPNVKMSSAEQTFIAIKPDGVQRGLIGPIVSRFENRGFKLAAIKLVTPSKEHLEAHYADLKDKPFFGGLIQYMLSGPICAMVWEGRDAVKTGRSILGATNPLASAPGTIRGDFAIDVGRNVCHGSDSVENAKKEIALWFKEGDVVSYKASQFDWIYEKA